MRRLSDTRSGLSRYSRSVPRAGRSARRLVSQRCALRAEELPASGLLDEQVRVTPARRHRVGAEPDRHLGAPDHDRDARTGAHRRLGSAARRASKNASSLASTPTRISVTHVQTRDGDGHPRPGTPPTTATVLVVPGSGCSWTAFAAPDLARDDRGIDRARRKPGRRFPRRDRGPGQPWVGTSPLLCADSALVRRVPWSGSPARLKAVTVITS